MANITHKDFSGGWMPGNDPINGSPNALLKMDNVDLDTNGALSMIGGTAVVGSAYANNLHTLYSRTMGGSRKVYGADTAGVILRDNTSIGTGGDSTIAAFSTAFDYTIACSGTKRIKDTGSGTPVSLGVGAPTAAPTFISADLPIDAPFQTWGSLLANYVMFVGTGSVIVETNYGGVGHGSSHARPAPISYLQVTADTDGNAAVQTYNGGGPYDMTVLTSSFGGTGTAKDDDIFPFFGYVDNPFGASLQIDILLTAGNSDGNQVPDYYTYKIDDLSNLSFDSHTGAFFIILKRSDFTKVGTSTNGWNATYGYRLTFKGTNGQIINFLGASLKPAAGSSMFVYGGTNSQNGSYQFAQVNVNNTGTYLALSPMGPPTNAISIISSQAYLTAQSPTAIDTQVNEVWIFARSSGGENGLGTASVLDQWYRVAKLTSAFSTNFHVQLGDLDALKLNIKFNTSLVTIASSGISDKILAIVGPIQSRWYYFTSKLMYPSDIDNPDLVDPRIAIRLTGSNNEIFLWAKQVDRATVLIGTSLDVYVLTGTFTTLPDFTVDIYYHALGCKYPPITYDADVYNGDVVYLANDGWRIINVNKENPLMVSPGLDLLYKGITRYSYTAPNLKIAPGSVRFPICIARNKIWCFITGTHRCEVFDFTRKYWRTFNYSLGDVGVATSSQDGQVLAFYTSDNKLRELDIKTSKLIDGATKQTVNVLFQVNDGGSPRNRKDSETFKTRVYTGGDSLPLTIKNDLNNTSTFGVTSAAAGLDKFFDLSTDVNIKICKTYQVNLVGQIADFLLEDWSIEYSQRPDQLTFLRVLPNNLGTSGLKRIFSQPFQIDTLGNDVSLIPYLDGLAFDPLIVNSTYKKSFTYEYLLFDIDILKAKDYEYVFSSSGLFEFFGFQEPRNVEVFPEPRRTHVLPVTNFGSPSKKRLRVWPFVVDPRGQALTFTPIVDQIPLPALNATFSHTGKKLVYVQYTTDVFGVDYSGYWQCGGEWEFWEALQPTIVQTLPIAKRFDQIGPEEFFRYGKIKQFELRVMPMGGSFIPYTIYFADSVERNGIVAVVPNVEDSYYIDVPKGTSGRITRVVFGPTTFDFHRFYVRLLVTESGKDTELRWVSVE